MMKKILSLILAAALLLGCGSALAETAEKTEIGSLNVVDAFTLKCAIPENYKIEVVEQTNDKIIATLNCEEDITKPFVMISIAYNDQYADVERLNDLSDEQLQIIERSFTDEDDVTIEYKETGLGTKLMVVTEDVSDGVSFVDIYTIYKGFETDFVLVPGADVEKGEIYPLTEEAIQMLIDFITGIDFVEAEAAK